MKGIDLGHIYNLRSSFTLVGLTGTTSSGCGEVAAQLVKGFSEGEDFTNPVDNLSLYSNKKANFNSFRKHRVVFNYAKENFSPYTEIKYKNVVTLFLLEYSFEDLISFLKNTFPECPENADNLVDFDAEIINLTELKRKFQGFSTKFLALGPKELKENGNWEKMYDLFFSASFADFNNKLHQALGKNSLIMPNAAFKYHLLFQIICNNLRKSGNPYDHSEPMSTNIFSIVERINLIVKAHREKFNGANSKIVVNSLKNPLEIMFFKHRYSAFYAVAIHKDPDQLEGSIRSKFTMVEDGLILKQLIKILEEEYQGGANKEFYKQKVSECLQLADIHISFIERDIATKRNKENFSGPGQKTSSTVQFTPFFSWQDQLLKFISLISHPGIVSPSPEERCMQLAFTAKHNSGCISRHVGAAVTDNDFSVKAIGWNSTPSGQVPCSLRNANDLIENNFDNDSFTAYEKGAGGDSFRQSVVDNYQEQTKLNESKLKGRNVCFCFKTLKNSFSEGKNQVHTRSLHAEENAFLQLAKNGSQGIKNGILFSTASPCELCSKKAYQLGIKLIYYIDPYPGISKPHILSTGENPIEVRLFNGAIGSAYHKLFQPMLPYKDELSLLLGQDIKDLTTKYKSENEELKIMHEHVVKENQDEIGKLKARLAKFENLKGSIQ